jgi:ribosome-binding protein aMBF1 (putative translation factor)
MTKKRKPAARKAPLVPADEVFAKARRDPAYGKAFDALDEEFALVAALIKARTDAGLTQQQVAKRMKTSQGVIARLEGGGRQPSTRTLRRFARATRHRLKISFEPEPAERSKRTTR